MRGSCERCRVAGKLALSLLLAFGLGEILVRFAGHSDADGQFWIGERRVPPYRLPIAKISAALRQLSEADLIAPDPALGWSHRPSVASRDGKFSVDSVGSRGHGERLEHPAPGVLRITVFGDSFTFGDEVANQETWAARLETLLVERGVAAEVLNFGVNAYGIDQALLRWEREARRLRPHVVILGFQPENLLRNLNILRPLYFMDTGVPYSKPRFVLDGQDLRVVNQPTVPLSDLPRVLADPERSPVAADDRFLGQAYRSQWWQRSRLLAFLAEIASSGGGVPGFALEPEMSEVGHRIVRRFARTAREAGAAFLIVHLPRRDELAEYAAGREPWHEPFLRELAAARTLVRPEGRFVPVTGDDFQPRGHYGPRLHRLVAEALVDPVLANLGRAGAPERRPPHRAGSRPLY